MRFSPAEPAAGLPPENDRADEEEEAPLPTLEEVARRTNSVCRELAGEAPRGSSGCWFASLSTDTLWLAPGTLPETWNPFFFFFSPPRPHRGKFGLRSREGSPGMRRCFRHRDGVGGCVSFGERRPKIPAGSRRVLPGGVEELPADSDCRFHPQQRAEGMDPSGFRSRRLPWMRGDRRTSRPLPLRPWSPSTPWGRRGRCEVWLPGAF